MTDSNKTPLPVDADGARPIDHVKALRRGERQPQLRVDKLAAFDHPLLGIITVKQPVNSAEECVAAGDSARQTLRFGQRRLHPACRIRVSRCPSRNRGIAAALQLRVERILRRKTGQNGAHRLWIIASAAEIGDAQIVRFKLLRARETQCKQL